MSGIEIAAIITAIGGFITAVGALAIGVVRLFDDAKDTKEKIAALQKEIDGYKNQVDDFDKYKIRTRTELNLIGSSLGDARYDTAAMALLINQLFDQYKSAIGKPPEVNIEMLKHMRTIGYVTGPLGPLDVEAFKQ